MRKLISYAFLAGLMLVAGVVNAQDYAFRVLANKGTNQVKKAGSGGVEALKTGAKLGLGDEIIASEDAYIGLMHNSGKTTEIRGAGTKKVSELEKNISTASTSVTSRYASFIASKMNEDEGSASARTKLAATGAVSREVFGALASFPIPIAAPAQADLLGDIAIVRWTQPEKFGASDSYIVKIKNIFDEVIHTDETNKTSITLDFSQDGLAYDMGLYIVTVYKKGDEEVKSGDLGIKKIPSEDKVELHESYANLKAEISEDSPINKIIYASFYEQNGLVLDALTKYEEAIKMSPDVEDFQELYKNFLITNGLAK